MTPEDKQLNFVKGFEMLKLHQGYVVMMIFSYNPETGRWNMTAHEGLTPVLTDDEQREKFKENLCIFIDHAAHPENLRIIHPGEAPPQPADRDALERMMEQESDPE